MNILLIGSGGREHAIAELLVRSPRISTLYCLPGNPGIGVIATLVSIPLTDHTAIIQWCLQSNIDCVIIGPEAPLAEGLSDALRVHDILVFGPSQAASQLEASKDFAKKLMQQYHIPTAAYQTFTLEQVDQAITYCKSHPLPIVVKADGLAAGKGVTVAETTQEAIEAVQSAFAGKFGVAGTRVVIEEFLRGEEASVFALCDGERFVTLAPAQDHKRIADGDLGENTGGMGAYAPAPIVNDVVMRKVEERIIKPLLMGMKSDGIPFVGCLFCGLMIDNNEPSVVEFNVRFGDPETQAVLAVFRGDLLSLMISAAQGHLDTSVIQSIAEGHACVVIMASEGYPGAYKKGSVIKGIDSAQAIAQVYHAGTTQVGADIVASGGRVLGICGVGNTLSDAIQRSYDAVQNIQFDGAIYRSDIGAKGLKSV